MIECERIKIKDLAEVVTGGTPSTSKKEYWDGDIPWLQSGVCQNCEIDHADTFITELGLKESAAKMMPRDTVIIALTGATTGKTGLLKVEACANQSVTGILPNNRFLPYYLFYYLISIRDKILYDSYGGAQKHISQGYVKEIEIPLPSIEKQKEIVKKIGTVKKVINIKKEQLKEMDNLIKSQFVEMFEKGEYPKDEFINIAKEIYAGGDKPKDISKIQEGEYLYPVFANGYENEGLQGYSKGYRTGDSAVTISARGTIGYSFIRNEKFTPIVRLITIIPNEKANVVYLKYAIDNLIIAGSGTSQAQLTVPDIKKKKITIPPIELQNKFAEFVKQIDKQKFEIQKSLEEIQMIQESLMNKYFGG